MPEASRRLIWPRTAGSNAMRTIPAMSAARARPSTVTPHEPRADSRPARVCPVSVIASARFRGAAGEAAGLNVTDDPGVDVGCGGGRGGDELVHDRDGGARGGGVDRGGDLAGERGPGVGRGVDGDGHPADRGQVAQRRQPGAPVGDPPVGVAGVGQPGRGRHDPQRGGQVPGAPVADQAVPAAVAVLGRQQLGRGQRAGQLQHSGVPEHDLGAVGGVPGAGAVVPARPLDGELGERDPADPDQAGRPGQQRGRTYI